MILLAALLSFGWPALDIEFGPPKPLPAGMERKTVATCCGSMRPTFRGGETIYVSPPTPIEHLLGKVVSTGAALHQVTAETPTAVRTAGIANQHSDGWTPRAKVEYVVRYVVRPKT